MIERIERLFNKYPAILVILSGVAIGFFLWWMNQPVKIIYDPDAPAIWIDDDPEGGYFPRR